MSDPKQKIENTWVQRFLRLFKRNKTTTPKQKTEVTSQDRDKRGFTISIITGSLMWLIVIGYMFSYKDRPINSLVDLIFDTRVLAGTIGTAAFISAWLSRKGQVTLGAILILIALYLAILSSAALNAGGGMASAAFAIAITLGITSAVMPPILARRVNSVAMFVAAIPVLLDLFEPYSRAADPSPGGSATFAIMILVVFSFLIVRRFSTYNLRTKLLIAFAAVTVLPLLTLGFYANTRLSDALYQSTQATLGQFANQAASRIDTFIENQLIGINVQSQNPPFIQFLSLNPTENKDGSEKNSAKDALAAIAGQDKFINAVMLLNVQSDIVLQFAKVAAENESQQAKFLNQVTTAKGVNIQGPLIDQKSGQASIYFTAPIKNKAGSFLGTLVIEYNANVIESIIRSLILSNVSNPVSFHVVDTNNFIRIVNTDDSTLLYKSYKDFTPTEITALQKKNLLLPGSAQNALATESETIAGLEKIDQSPFFTTTADKTLKSKNNNSAARLKTVPWLAFVRQSEAAVLGPLIDQRRITTLIFIFLLFLVTLAAIGLSQLLASPILKLATVAEKIAAGDLSLQSDIESNDEIGTLAKAFNEMTRQSRALIDSLEQRSKALATSSEVSRRISTILDQQELVTEVVKQVQSAFNYYHAHIYLLDENTQELIMAGGTGEAGKAMLARGHKIPVGKGLVGRAAQNNITVLVADVAEEPQWLPNPLLPDTKSEVAVPISIAERVLGVLDVQHDVAGTLKQEDVDVLQSIANQVAFAVRNARSYSEVQAKADRESLITSIGQKIQGTITVESALQVAIREIGRALNGAKTQIVLNENSTADNIQKDDNTAVKL